jgi:transposase InsO family protein
VIIDSYSRYVVGWMIAHQEATDLARELIRETSVRQGIVEGPLTLHADRGSSMTSRGVEQLLADLGVIRGLMFPTTPRIPRHTSRRSNTVLNFPPGLVRSKIPAQP